MHIRPASAGEGHLADHADSPPPPKSFMPWIRPLELTSKQAWMSGSFMIGSPSCTAPRDSSSEAELQLGRGECDAVDAVAAGTSAAK